MITHPRVYIVAGCALTPAMIGVGEEVERVSSSTEAEFWAYYLVAPDGRQVWQADYTERDSVIAAAHAVAGGAPVFIEENGRLVRSHFAR
jgi:hypothetical protein